MHLFFRFLGKITFICYISLILLNTSCVKKEQNNTKLIISSKKESINNNKIIQIINEKIKTGNLKYEDIFEQEYYNYNDMNEENKNELEELLKNFKNSLKKKRINVDEILENKTDVLIEKIIDQKNMKYSLYGSKSGEKWFVKNKDLKSPLNYFQQMFLLEASPKFLEEVTCKMVKRIMNGDKIYDSYYGSFWVVYNRKNKLEKSFKIFNNAVENVKNKSKKKHKLTEKDINILKTVLSMKKINNIETEGTDEYFAKIAFVVKSSKVIKKAEKIMLSIKK